MQESDAKTIRLIGDDPASVSAMLTWVYKQQIVLSNTERRLSANMRYCVELFRVADKYDLPMLCSDIQDRFHTQLHVWLCRAQHESEDPALNERVYTLPNKKPSHPLVMSLLAMTKYVPLQILQNDGEAPSMLIKAAKDVSEFGGDIFLFLMDKTKSDVNPETGVKSITELDI